MAVRVDQYCVSQVPPLQLTHTKQAQETERQDEEVDYPGMSSAEE